MSHLDPILVNDQGGAICVGDQVAAVEGLERFNIILFAAAEFPPPYELLAKSPTSSRSMICRVPLVTSMRGVISRGEVVAAGKAAEFVKKGYLDNRPVLITSTDGRHRAPFIAALALHLLEEMGGLSALREVRTARKIDGVLTNPSHVEVLRGLEPAARDVLIAS